MPLKDLKTGLTRLIVCNYHKRTKQLASLIPHFQEFRLNPLQNLAQPISEMPISIPLQLIMSQGWASEGYTAADIDPLARGVGWLLSETGIPRRIKAAYLDDDTIKYLAAYAARLRGNKAAA